MSKTMQAYRLHAYGGPSNLTLDTIPIPTPGPKEVLIEISHVGINPLDWKVREGYVKDHMPLPLPYTLGVDFIGTISSLGPSCTSRFKKGDRVMTFSQTLRAFAEYIVVPESILAKVPQGLSDEQAATLPIPALTAWQGVHAIGAPKKGMKVLIHGASGVCGAFAVQFAKLAGMYVIGTASGKNKPYVLSLGADEFIDYNTQTFEDLISSIDLILDFVLVGGSMSTTDRSWKVLKKGGMLVSFADPGVSVPEGYRGVFLQTKVDVEVLEDVGEMVVQGKVKSKVARVFGRGEVGEAMEVSRAGGGMGRLLVDFGRV